MVRQNQYKAFHLLDNKMLMYCTTKEELLDNQRNTPCNKINDLPICSKVFVLQGGANTLRDAL